ncbi:helix-turn-helix domain-containing protein [Catenulispora rubra]|uniref:helix-turn-helix domain-containing protein n=1 Tax=Catenulispora rubra TaxID=280293 RepID=UPI001891F865|nr:helix-turn-helix transcriptional regulator [Catenulispora rubra]
MGKQPRQLSPHVSLEHFIGAELRRFRTQHGLSHKQIAARVHVSAELIGRIERAERRLSAELAVELDGVLETDGVLVQAVLQRSPVRSAASRRANPLDPVTELGSLVRLDVGEAAEILERATMRIAEYPNHAPTSLWFETQRDLQAATKLLRGPSSLRAHRALLGGVAILAGTAAHLLMDLDDRPNGRRYLELSHEAGRDLEDPGLLAWSLGMGVIDSLIDADFDRSVRMSEEAAALPVQSRRQQAWLNALRARAYAGAGEEHVALSALERAYAELEAAEEPTALAFFDEARLEGMAGTTQLLLGRPADAVRTIDAAISRRDREDVKGIALLMLDQAECQIHIGDPESAVARITAAVELSEKQMVAPIRARLTILCRQLARWSQTAAVMGLEGLLTASTLPVGKA